MTRRREYMEPGWSERPVWWSYSVGFKKPRGHRLLWISTSAQTVTEASKEAAALIAKHRPGEGFLEYGITKTYWRHFGGYDKPITKEDYDSAVKRGLRIPPR